jgi:hypothetical protein
MSISRFSGPVVNAVVVRPLSNDPVDAKTTIQNSFYQQNVVSIGDAVITRAQAIEVMKYFRDNSRIKERTLNGMTYIFKKDEHDLPYLSVSGKQGGFFGVLSDLKWGIINLTNGPLGGLEKPN